MANNENQSKKRYYPLRDTENPYKVSLVEITEAQYRALYPEIWATQKREQYHHRCMCTKKYLWKCDGNCDLCEYHSAGDTLSLDVEFDIENSVLYVYFDIEFTQAVDRGVEYDDMSELILTGGI